MKKQSWFEVDRAGLRKLIEDKGPAAVVVELVQNAWDQDVTRVDVTLRLTPGKPVAEIVVEDDDPAGFAELDHSFTLFDESAKQADPEKRGRFNIGEKLVLSLCSEATISSTTGTIRFDAKGRHRSGIRRERGSRFEGTLRLTREDYAAVEAAPAESHPAQGHHDAFQRRNARGARSPRRADRDAANCRGGRRRRAAPRYAHADGSGVIAAWR